MHNYVSPFRLHMISMKYNIDKFNSTLQWKVFTAFLQTSSVPMADFSVCSECFLVHEPERFEHVEDVSPKPQQLPNKGGSAPHIGHQQDFVDGSLVSGYFRFYKMYSTN